MVHTGYKFFLLLSLFRWAAADGLIDGPVLGCSCSDPVREYGKKWVRSETVQPFSFSGIDWIVASHKAGSLMIESILILNTEYNRYVALALEIGEPFPHKRPFVGLRGR